MYQVLVQVLPILRKVLFRLIIVLLIPYVIYGIPLAFTIDNKIRNNTLRKWEELVFVYSTIVMVVLIVIAIVIGNGKPPMSAEAYHEFRAAKKVYESITPDNGEAYEFIAEQAERYNKQLIKAQGDLANSLEYIGVEVPDGFIEEEPIKVQGVGVQYE